MQLLLDRCKFAFSFRRASRAASSAVEQGPKLPLLSCAAVGLIVVNPAGHRTEAAPGVLPPDVLHAALFLGNLIVSGVVHFSFSLRVCFYFLYGRTEALFAGFIWFFGFLVLFFWKKAKKRRGLLFEQFPRRSNHTIGWLYKVFHRIAPSI